MQLGSARNQIPKKQSQNWTRLDQRMLSKIYEFNTLPYGWRFASTLNSMEFSEEKWLINWLIRKSVQQMLNWKRLRGIMRKCMGCDANIEIFHHRPVKQTRFHPFRKSCKMMNTNIWQCKCFHSIWWFEGEAFRMMRIISIKKWRIEKVSALIQVMLAFFGWQPSKRYESPNRISKCICQVPVYGGCFFLFGCFSLHVLFFIDAYLCTRVCVIVSKGKNRW